jgi:predicted DNA-binding transcriptional regulator AlpA
MVQSGVMPKYLRIPSAVEYSGLSRTRLYEVMSRLNVIKAGRTTLISRASLAWISTEQS